MRVSLTYFLAERVCVTHEANRVQWIVGHIDLPVHDHTLVIYNHHYILLYLSIPISSIVFFGPIWLDIRPVWDRLEPACTYRRHLCRRDRNDHQQMLVLLRDQRLHDRWCRGRS